MKPAGITMWPQMKVGSVWDWRCCNIKLGVIEGARQKVNLGLCDMLRGLLAWECDHRWKLEVFEVMQYQLGVIGRRYLESKLWTLWHVGRPACIIMWPQMKVRGVWSWRWCNIKLGAIEGGLVEGWTLDLVTHEQSTPAGPGWRPQCPTMWPFYRKLQFGGFSSRHQYHITNTSSAIIIIYFFTFFARWSSRLNEFQK